MTIRAITRAIKTRRFATYDLEWDPETMRPRLYGFYDGSHYIAFRKVEAFMKHVLRDEYAGWWFFAHAGGIADLPFLLQWMVDHPSHQTTARFSGSAAVMVDVARKVQTQGSKQWKKGPTWTFVDSFFLLRTRLRNIGKWVGMDKGGEDGSTSIFYAPWPELRDYNEKDCTVLHFALQKFAELLEQLGGEMMPTIASTAMRLFRRKYLGADIRTMAATNTELRSSYASSRVEVFSKQIRDANQYDINSSFPFSMTKPVPGELMRVSRNIPTGESTCWFADVTVFVPEMAIPPLPYRRGNKVFFPTGRISGWMSGVDIRFLEERGGRVESVREVLVYDERHDLANYVNDLYERRRTATTEFEKVIFKFLLNALYGKFGERTEKTTLYLNPTNRNLVYDTKDGTRSAEVLFPGAILVTEDKPIAHEHIPIASHVVAQSRKLLGDGMYEAMDICGEVPSYVDTDCCVTHAVLPTSDKLGAWKLEREVKFGEFFAPKFYRIDGKIKAKGFSGISPEGFQRLVEGFQGQYERQARPREMLRSANLTARKLLIPKQLRFKVENEKRVFSEDGMSSRPYTVEEINKRFPRG